MKVNSTQFNATKSVLTSPSADKPAASIKQNKSAATDKNTFSAALRDAQTELRNMPDVDLDKVAELKAAIRDGQISINAEELADAMQKYFRG